MSKKQLYNKLSKEELKHQFATDSTKRITVSFYQYAHIEEPMEFRDLMYELLEKQMVFGRVYVSSEGVNAQVSVPEERWTAFEEGLNTIDFLRGIRLNKAIEDDGKSFYKLKIKVRPKIVADGLDDTSFDVTNRGIHLDAKSFNELADDPDTIIVDMRNHYESEVGHFKGAITPDVETFREELPLVEELLSNKKDKNILLYCTGGIRCEKASAYYRHKGFKNIHQLEGGIIEYARQVQLQGLENKFVGKNFVFDERLGERISDEIISSCHQCGSPCDTHVNCENDSCHILFIQCVSCAEEYHNCCSAKCKDFKNLPIDEQEKLKPKTVFNGMKLGKGRYKAHHKKESLDIE